MANIWIPEISIAEKILRSVAIYVFQLLAFRFGEQWPGSRQTLNCGE